ncbi:histone-lysine N-methyltransferase SETMAR [Trichonephila clavipes]|nr:histone-lysine N-methyltransferase SETMAR [Trichonephila clavipes]
MVMQVPTVQEKRWKKLMDWGKRYCLHLPYSPDIVPTGFHLFCSMQHFLTNKKIQNLDDMKNTISRYFTEKPIDFYRSGIENLPIRWQKVVTNESDYIID